MTEWVRPAAVAGAFYPEDPVALRHSVAECVNGAIRPPAAPAAKAVIAPHAGYRYSGPVAASAYVALKVGAPTARVVLAGPAHRTRLRGVAVSSASSFATPLGPIEVDAAARSTVLGVDGVAIDDDAHAFEHSLEVHLPFIVELLGAVPVLPMLVGWPGPEVFARALDVLWDGDETRIVVSTDLSHYHDAATVRALDRRTADAIVDCRPDALGPEQACGAASVRGLLIAAPSHGLSVRLLDLRNSADTAGDPHRVVGYGAFALG